MIIKKKRIRNPARYLTEFKPNEKIRIGVKITNESKENLIKMGFDKGIVEGEIIVPLANCSKVAYENAEGKCIVRRDLPKETAERYWEWSWEDWGHNIHSDFKYIPYERYQREYLPPRALEVMIIKDKENQNWVVSKEINNTDSAYDDIKLLVNLFLSIFKECEIINKNLEQPIKTVRKVKWEILRPGTKTRQAIVNVIRELTPENKQNMYVRNIDKLMENSDENIAIGTAEFRGYIVFICGKFAILESLMPNNATYILGKNWEDISKLTKTEVLNKNLHIARIYHYLDWEQKIKKYTERPVN